MAMRRWPPRRLPMEDRRVTSGNGIVSVKPTLFAGGDRRGKWGIEVGFKVIGF
jgi:hypothetical protein